MNLDEMPDCVTLQPFVFAQILERERERELKNCYFQSPQPQSVQGSKTEGVALRTLANHQYLFNRCLEEKSLKNTIMMIILDRFLHKYGDPRVKDYFLMQSPFPTMAISALFVFIVKVNRIGVSQFE
jgi:hypothetical protein